MMMMMMMLVLGSYDDRDAINMFLKITVTTMIAHGSHGDGDAINMFLEAMMRLRLRLLMSSL